VITEYESDTGAPSMTLNFDTRKSAEMAMNKGKVFGESVLDIKWVTSGNSESGDSQETAPGSKNGDASQSGENGASIEDDEAGFS
jgi:hypothetical protein